MKLCTQKAQQDLRHEENIDAFSMSGDTGRFSPAILADDDTAGIIFLSISSKLIPKKLIKIS